MPDRVDILIDSAADLQRQINQLNEEVLALALALLGLGLGYLLMCWKLWRP